MGYANSVYLLEASKVDVLAEARASDRYLPPEDVAEIPEDDDD